VNLQALVVVAVLAGCGSQGLVRGTTDPGGSVLAADVTQVTYTSLGGGFGPAPVPGAACDPGAWSYVISFGPETCASTTCTVDGSYDDPASFVPHAEQITLDETQWQMVKAAIAAVTISTKTSCGADLGQRQLEVDSGTGLLTYGDDFYACEPNYPYFVTTASLDNLWTVLSAIP
jgi:hypothetical protein